MVSVSCISSFRLLDMAGKTLSNGTLSLRFMQNAQRAKLQAQVEAEQAKVKDDAEWSVSQEVRDAWGLGASSSKQYVCSISVQTMGS